MPQNNRDQLLKDIIDIELRMFMALEPSIPSACQEEPATFKVMRRGSFTVLSDETLASYLEDLEEAIEENRNLMELKYARIDDLIPPLNISPVIDRIVEIERKWMNELAEKYPLTFRGRADYAAGTYLRGELETYSNKTLDLYLKDVLQAVEEGRNLTEQRNAYIFREAGYDSIQDVEKERERAG